MARPSDDLGRQNLARIVADLATRIDRIDKQASKQAYTSPDYAPGVPGAGWGINSDGLNTIEADTISARDYLQLSPSPYGAFFQILMAGGYISLTSQPDSDGPFGTGTTYDAPGKLLMTQTSAGGGAGWYLTSPTTAGFTGSGALQLSGDDSGAQAQAILSTTPGGVVTLSAFGGVIMANGTYIGCNMDGISNPATTAGGDLLTSGSYANMAGTGSVTSFTFNKQYDNSRLIVSMNVGCYCQTSAGTSMQYGVQVDGGTDYTAGSYTFNTLNDHRFVSSFTVIPPGLIAGPHTIQGRWKRTAGTGTVVHDVNDWLSILVQETT